MKKIIFTLSLIITSLFINTNVNALTRNPDLVYDIESFEVTQSDIIFKGWAYIGDYNNYGGDTTIISIIADNGKETMEKQPEKYNGDMNKPLYYASCFRNEKNNCYESYEKSTCKGDYRLPSCRYDNVGFTIKFNIQDLFIKLGSDRTINFKLKVYNSNYGDSKISSIAVDTLVTNFEDNKIKIDSINAQVIVNGISETAKIVEPEARILTSAGGFMHGSDFTWRKNEVYKIKGQTKIKSGTYEGSRMYKLEYKAVCCSKLSNYPDTNKCKKCDNSSTNYNGFGIPLNTFSNKFSFKTVVEEGWAYASWLQVDGAVSINFAKTCPSEYNNQPQTLKCENGIYNQVKNYGIVITDSFDNEQYKQYSQNTGKCTSEVKRTIQGEISVTQRGTATFALDKSYLYAGGGFSVSANYKGIATYELCGPFTYTIAHKEEKDGICIEVTSQSEIVAQDSKEWKRVTEYIQTNLLEKPKSNAKTLSFDSNKVEKDNINPNIEIGKWETEYINDTNGDLTRWEPGEEIRYNLYFNLNKACINRQTSKVSYIPFEESCSENELEGGQLYYIPLKQPTGTFPIHVTIKDLNILRDQVWPLNYECGVNCNQDLYNDDLSYKFIYRPISLSNPFPNRLPLNNWVKLYEDKDAFTKAMSRNDLEYQVTLTPTTIAKIKKDNKNSKYTSLSGISKTGQSSFLNDLIGTDRTNTFNNLGECNNNCWITESLSEVTE